MNMYIRGDIAHSQFDYLPEIYARHFSNAGLQECIRAVGLAAFAKTTRRKDYLEPAMKSYVSALRNVNSTMSTPAKAVQDSTLICVLLLAIFEVMTCKDGLGSLTKHLNGAMLIGTLLSKKERQTEFSEQLLGTIHQSMIMNCWVQNLTLPTGFDVLKEYADRTSRKPKLQVRLLDGLVGFIKFRQSLLEDRHSPVSSRIAQATHLDDQFRCLLDDMQKTSQWAFQTIYDSTEHHHIAYKGYYHIYPKSLTAHLWNTIRSARIRLHNYIVMKCQQLLSSTSQDPDQDTAVSISSQLQTSKIAVCTIAVEVLATVPQLAGFLAALPSPFPSSSAHVGSDTSVPSTTTSHPNVLWTVPSTSISTTQHAPSPSTSMLPPSTSGPTSCPTSNPPAQATPTPTPPAPRRGSQGSPYHLFHALYMVSTITLLPGDMQGWIGEKIAGVESEVEAEDLRLLYALRDSVARGALPAFAET
jgi:hypothetical protein